MRQISPDERFPALPATYDMVNKLVDEALVIQQYEKFSRNQTAPDYYCNYAHYPTGDSYVGIGVKGGTDIPLVVMHVAEKIVGEYIDDAILTKKSFYSFASDNPSRRRYVCERIEESYLGTIADKETRIDVADPELMKRMRRHERSNWKRQIKYLNGVLDSQTFTIAHYGQLLQYVQAFDPDMAYPFS